MDNLSPAQQAVIKALISDGSIPVNDVHTLTAKALKGEGLIIQEGENFVFSVAGCAEFCEPEEKVLEPPFGFDDSEPEDVPIETEEPKGAEAVIIHQVVTLQDDVSIQVDKDGKLVKIPAGTQVPVLSYSEEITRRGVIKWFSVIFPPTMTIFQVSSLRNKSHPIEAIPLTEF